MSKKKQPTPKPATTAKNTPVAQVRKPEPRASLINWQGGDQSSAQDALYKKVFWGSALFCLLITVIMALGSGINGDDEYQVDYSEKLVNYYATAGSDTSALNIPKGNMHYYGGFFDLVAGAANHTLGFDEFDLGYHRLRHVLIAIFGFLTMLFTGLLAERIAGWRAGILAMVLLFLSPRFLGHSLMNPKDIPFAAGFAIGLYYLLEVMRSLPKLDWKPILGLTLGIALAFATRAGGLLLVAYTGLFLGIDFLTKYGIGGIFTHIKSTLNYALCLAAVVVGAYFLAVLTWPAALDDPMGLPFKALSEFSKLGVRIRVLFMGDNVLSDATPWYYAPLWILKTIPFYTILGMAGGFLLLPKLLGRYGVLPVALAFFAAIFPLAYIIYKDSLLHDGWRHLLFVYPPMVVVAALSWTTLEQWLQKPLRYAVWGLLLVTALDPFIFIVRNPAYPYVYFNTLGGGIKGAYGHYETDYWGTSVKQAVDWMKKEGIISPNMKDTVVIGTSFYYNVSRQLGKDIRDKVRMKYVRFNSRYTESWDYGIFPSRYIRGPHLLAKTWPNSKTVHVVSANGVPLTAIEKDVDKHSYKGEAAIKAQQFNVAIEEFKAETTKYPDNELAWAGLANAYLNSGNTQEAIAAVNQMLKIAPENETGLYYLGMAYLRSGDNNNALTTFEQFVKVNDENSMVYYYLGLLYQSRQDLTLAIKNALLSIEYNPRFKQAYQLAAAIYEQQGDAQSAARYKQAADSL